MRYCTDFVKARQSVGSDWSIAKFVQTYLVPSLQIPNRAEQLIYLLWINAYQELSQNNQIMVIILEVLYPHCHELIKNVLFNDISRLTNDFQIYLKRDCVQIAFALIDFKINSVKMSQNKERSKTHLKTAQLMLQYLRKGLIKQNGLEARLRQYERSIQRLSSEIEKEDPLLSIFQSSDDSEEKDAKMARHNKILKTKKSTNSATSNVFQTKRKIKY